MLSGLGKKEFEPETILNLSRKFTIIPLAGGDPKQRPVPA
jgi:hypothetical protein